MREVFLAMAEHRGKQGGWGAANDPDSGSRTDAWQQHSTQKDSPGTPVNLNPLSWPVLGKVAAAAIFAAGAGSGAALVMNSGYGRVSLSPYAACAERVRATQPESTDSSVQSSCAALAGAPAPSSAPAPASNSAPVATPAEEPGMTIFICSGPSSASLLQWQDDNGYLSGSYEYSSISGQAPQEQVTSDQGDLTGTLNGNAISLTIGLQEPLYGTLDAGQLTLNIPQADGSFQAGTCNSGSLSGWNSAVAALDSQIGSDNNTALQQQAQASQASANAAAEQQAQSDLSTLEGFSLSPDLSKLAGDLTQTSNDLAAEKTAAAAGPNADGGDCYNLTSNVDYDAQSNVAYDAQSDFGYDLQQNLVPDISSERQDISAFQTDLSNLQDMGLPAPSGAQAAITAAQNEIASAVSTANTDISQENGYVSQAYEVANSIATGSCAGDGPGSTPSPIQDIS